MSDIKIGDIVYTAYSPVRAGVVVGFSDVPHPDGVARKSVRVRMSNGVEYFAASTSVKSFVALVEQHERKAAKFREVLTKLQEMKS